MNFGCLNLNMWLLVGSHITFTSLVFHGGGDLIPASSILTLLSIFCNFIYLISVHKIKYIKYLSRSTVIQLTGKGALISFPNFLIGLSRITTDWSCSSGWIAWTAKLHQARDRKSMVSGCASEIVGLKSGSMQFES